jgi:hypothetical protein
MNRVNILLFLSILISLVLSSCTNTGSEKSAPDIDLTAFPEETCSVQLNMGGLPIRANLSLSAYNIRHFFK